MFSNSPKCNRVHWLYLDSLQEILGSVKFGIGDRAPIVAPDECQVGCREIGKLENVSQVIDPITGWVGFRAYGRETWDYVSATFLPKYLLTSATMSDASLARVAGELRGRK